MAEVIKREQARGDGRGAAGARRRIENKAQRQTAGSRTASRIHCIKSNKRAQAATASARATRVSIIDVSTDARDASLDSDAHSQSKPTVQLIHVQFNVISRSSLPRRNFSAPVRLALDSKWSRNFCWPPWPASNGALAAERWQRTALAMSTTAPNVFVEIRRIVICYVMPPGFTENDFPPAKQREPRHTLARTYSGCGGSGGGGPERGTTSTEMRCEKCEKWNECEALVYTQ